MRVRRSKCPLLSYQGEDPYREERQRHARDRRTKEGEREGCGKDGTAKPRETKEPSRARNKSEMGANGLTSLSFSLIYWRHRCEFGIPRGAVVSETIVLKCVSGLLFKTKRTTSLASTLGKVSVSSTSLTPLGLHGCWSIGWSVGYFCVFASGYVNLTCFSLSALSWVARHNIVILFVKGQ